MIPSPAPEKGLSDMEKKSGAFLGRVRAGGWVWNAYVAFTLLRFSHSLVNDVLWYAGLFRKSVLVLILTSLLSLAWLFRPWIDPEDVEE